MNAVFKVTQAGPLVSIQDRGRFGYLRYGVTQSGPMDRLGYELVNYALGRGGGPVIEVSMGGLALHCLEGAVTAAVAGGGFSVVLDGNPLPSWSVFTLETGSKLQIRPGAWGSWGYLAFAGDLTAPSWLGSQSAHLPSGLCGKALVVDDLLQVSAAKAANGAAHEILDADTLRPKGPVKVVFGPQDRFFDSESLTALVEAEFRLTPEYDRQGVRLSGPKLTINAALDMPSEPIARGTLQVPGHGDPICLLADHHTAGGYPKIATVISADQDKIAQLRSGEGVRFAAVSAEQAVEAARARAELLKALKDKIDAQAQSLTEKLWNNNLIGGLVDASAQE